MRAAHEILNNALEALESKGYVITDNAATVSGRVVFLNRCSDKADARIYLDETKPEDSLLVEHLPGQDAGCLPVTEFLENEAAENDAARFSSGELVIECLREAIYQFDDMRKTLRHFMAREVLARKQQGRKITEDIKNDLYLSATEKATVEYHRLFTLAVDVNKKHQEKVSLNVFNVFAAAQSDIPTCIARMSKRKLAFEIASTGVHVLNDHIGYTFSEREMEKGITKGTAIILRGEAKGKTIDKLPPFYIKGSSPQLRVF